jgi:predicted signal transduction protein with EAL and GGDEF domain
MPDFQERIEKRRRMLERLTGLIPGYNRYQQLEKRRDADRTNRDILYGDLKEQINALERINIALTDAKKIDNLDDVDRAIRKLRTVADRIRLADYGVSGFFDALKIEEEELDRMYDFDLSLAEQVKAIRDKVVEIKVDEPVIEHLLELDLLIDGLDQRFSKREQVMMGVQ